MLVRRFATQTCVGPCFPLHLFDVITTHNLDKIPYDDETCNNSLTATAMLMTKLYRLNKTSKNCDVLNKLHRHLCAKVSVFMQQIYTASVYAT